MFIAHLPAGYIGARAIERFCLKKSTKLNLWISRLFIVGNVVPDVDMFYFYLIDHKAHHHHLYWTHLPVFWVVFYLIILTTALIFRNRAIVNLGSAFVTGAMVHLVLDTPMGGVAWLYPYSKNLIYLTTVPARYNWWVWNFFLHWTFIIEVLISVVACVLFYSKHLRQTRDAKIGSDRPE